jgi:hypothetical protein
MTITQVKIKNGSNEYYYFITIKLTTHKILFTYTLISVIFPILQNFLPILLWCRSKKAKLSYSPIFTKVFSLISTKFYSIGILDSKDY